MNYKAGDKVILTNGNTMTVYQINDTLKWYFMKEDPLNCYTDEMIEGLVEEEEEVGLVDMLSSRWVNEFNLPEGYIFKDENGNVINATKIVLEKKKKEYPKTFVEVLDFWYPDRQLEDDYQRSYKKDLIKKFQDLLYARDAYWKIYGEEFNWDNALYYIYTNDYGNVIKSDDLTGRNCVLAFPDKASRDAFYKNFKKEIEMCKELL